MTDAVQTEKLKLDVPDLVQAVNAVIQTFAAFVGISLTDFFDDTKNTLGEDVRPWAFIALVALLLRYIVGSAVHLNRAYGKRTDQEGPTLRSIWLFIKDLLFLVAFGYVAIQITHSHAFLHFIREAAWFVGLGLLWSVTDPGFRRIFLCDRPTDASFNRLALKWAALDAFQLLVTVLIARYAAAGLYAVILTAAVYLIIFFVDMRFLLGSQK
ncbi:MAG TPA: hypothetical protein VEI03_19450 [Stellaceae bacterium]|nr:hypothetical protein [Stellaceae bacterium]